MEFLTNLEEFGDGILKLLITGLDTESLLSTIAFKIAENFQVDACLIVAIADDQRLAKSGYWSKQSELLIPNISVYVQKIPITSQAIAINFNPRTTENPAIEDLVKQLGWSSILYLHTYYQEQANGFIALGCFESHQWSSSAGDRLSKIAPFVSLAIAHQQIQQRQKRQSQHHSFLINLNREIERNPPLKIIFRLSLTGLGACLKINQAIISTLKYPDPLFIEHPQTKLTQIEAEIVSQWSPEYPRVPIRKVFELHNSLLCQKAWITRSQPLAINSFKDLEQLGITRLDAHLFRLQMFPSVLVVPILTTHIKSLSQEVILGFIILQKRQFRSWQSDEIQLAQAVATQLSMAMMQSQTLRQVQSLVEERTSQLKWSLDMQGKLFKKMRLQLEELKRLNQIKDDFIARLSDSLKLPLASMKMAISMLKVNKDREKFINYINILESECNKETQLINDLLTLQKIKNSQLEVHYESIDLREIIEQANQDFENNWSHKKVNLAVDFANQLPIIIYSDKDSLSRILNELLNNSGKFSFPNQTVNLSINKNQSSEKETINIKVTNLGKEISESEKKHIFEPFYRGKNSSVGSSQGTGLGLFLVKSLVEHLNGKIEFLSQATDNHSAFLTSFTITLPHLTEMSE